MPETDKLEETIQNTALDIVLLFWRDSARARVKRDEVATLLAVLICPLLDKARREEREQCARSIEEHLCNCPDDSGSCEACQLASVVRQEPT